MEWISVEDRLPKNGEYEAVLCCFKGWKGMFFQRILEYDFNSDEWIDHEGNICDNVTHWMSLPELPNL